MAAGTVVTPLLTHWGYYEVETRDGKVREVRGWGGDADNSPIGRSMRDVDHPLRVRRPAIRKGWLERGPESRGARGEEPFVEVDWDTVLDLVAKELARVREAHGNQAIYAGSYGWASAGRFHHALSQVHRFMSAIGGYTRSVNTYSLAAAEVIVPHVVGYSYDSVQNGATSLPVIAEHCDLFVAFGGVPLKNAQIQAGGQGRHVVRHWLREAKARGCHFVNVSPLREDIAEEFAPEWIAPRPGTDTALMLGLAHSLLEEGLHDRAFLARYCTGFERFAAYLTGESDGTAKTAAWAAEITGVLAATIRDLARRMAAGRTMINLSWSLQRQDHGEQSWWAGITLAAMLGQIGLPGGGFGPGYGSVGSVGNGVARRKIPALPRLANPVADFIPVARIADMLLQPGEAFDYDGRRYRYPDIRLVYWAGGNPFHHHQDLNRLVEAWRRPETVIVNEPFWTATARHADIVLPATTPLERNDIGGASSDNFVVAMKQAIAPVGEARNDYDIFAGLAGRLNVEEVFTEGLDEAGWLRRLYEDFRRRFNDVPDFDSFWAQNHLEFTDAVPGASHKVLLGDFRRDPEAHPLPTPSGRIEIFSETIAGFGYDDCPGHPSWMEPYERLGRADGRYPLHLVSNQPKTRLHSQWDHGEVSREAKVAGREVMTINPTDAAPRGIAEGDLVRLFNDRGQCLASATLSEAVMSGAVVLPTGAWFDPAAKAAGEGGRLERHGNPNVLTRDRGTSRLAQGPSAHTCLVEVERWRGPAPALAVTKPPELFDS